jgi:hypothetical protein
MGNLTPISSIFDKAKAVTAALLHPKGAGMSDRQIAEYIGVSSNTVLKYRDELVSTAQIAQSDSRVGRDGRTIDTSNIGKAAQMIAAAEAKARELFDKLAKERQKRKPADSVPVMLPEQKSDARDAAEGRRRLIARSHHVQLLRVA